MVVVGETGKPDVNKEERQKRFLARAQDAEQRAAKSADPGVRASWRKIADTYRVLARDA